MHAWSGTPTRLLHAAQLRMQDERRLGRPKSGSAVCFGGRAVMVMAVVGVLEAALALLRLPWLQCPRRLQCPLCLEHPRLRQGRLWGRPHLCKHRLKLCGLLLTAYSQRP